MIQRLSLLSGTNHELAADGSYLVAANPTFNTGLSTIAAPTAVDDTKPFLYIRGPSTPGKRFWLDYVRLTCTGPGTAGTKVYAVWRIDPVNKTDPTGGTVLAMNCPNSDSAPAFESKIWAGLVTVGAASGSVREVCKPLLKNGIPAVGDVYLQKFGGADQGISTSQGLAYYGGPPIILGVGQNAAMQLLLPAQSALSSYEIEVGGWERAA